MTCPSCNRELTLHTVATDSGAKLDVMHCGICGGTWFEAYDINRIPMHEVLRVADTSVQPKTPSFAATQLSCPNDHKKLEIQIMDGMPSGTSLYQCPSCHGIWATQRSLLEYKEFQESTIQGIKKGDGGFPSLSVVFVPTLLLLLLFLSTFATILNLSNTRENRIAATGMLKELNVKSLSPGSIHISFQTFNKVTSTVSFGITALDMTTRVVSSTPSMQHSILFTDLKPEIRYVYTITFTDEEGRSYTTPPQELRL